MSFNLIEDEYGDFSYIDKTKLSNGQLATIELQETLYNDSIYYNVAFIISSKRKNLDFNDTTYRKSTGKGSIEGLIWAKNKILDFEDFIKDEFLNKRYKIYITIGWDDNRRRNVYVKEMTKHNYHLTTHDNKKVLLKRIR